MNFNISPEKLDQCIELLNALVTASIVQAILLSVIALAMVVKK